MNRKKYCKKINYKGKQRLLSKRIIFGSSGIPVGKKCRCPL